MTAPDLLVALDPVLDALRALHVRCHVGGSVASSAQGVARATLDVDIVADLLLPHVRPLVDALRDACYIDEEAVRDAVRRRASFNVIHLATMLEIDVFVRKDTPYDRQAFERMVPDTLGDGPLARELFLSSPEDTILNKLDGYRLGEGVSERQWYVPSRLARSLTAPGVAGRCR